MRDDAEECLMKLKGMTVDEARAEMLAKKAKSVPVLNANGGDVKSEEYQFDKKENIKLITGSDKGGTSSKYRISKLKRDHPEIAERMIAGEFKTVSEAERATTDITE